MNIRSLLLGVLFLIATSCSTLFHQRTVGVNFYSNIDSSLVCIKNKNECYVTPVKIDLTRSKDEIEFIIKKDTLKKNFSLKGKLSTAFWIGNLFSGIGIFGYPIDLTNPKRFTYPKNVYVQFLNDNNIKIHKWVPPVRNQLNFKISIPEGNFFYINKQDGYGNDFGFLGLSAGLEYYFSDYYSINTDIGTITDFMLPIPAPIDFEGTYDRSFVSYVDLQLGRDFQSFNTSIGLQGNMTYYYRRETVELFPQYIDTLKYSMQQFNLGLAFSAYYKITNGFNLGINYYPSILTWNNDKFNLHYNHFITFNLIFKIQIFRPLIETAGYRKQYGP